MSSERQVFTVKVERDDKSVYTRNIWAADAEAAMAVFRKNNSDMIIDVQVAENQDSFGEVD